MTIFQRQQAILRLLESRSEVTIAILAKKLEVSPNTVRNDLSALADQGRLRRVRGGAVASQTTKSSIAAARLPEELEMIANGAAVLVRDGDTIVLDAGDAALALARELRSKKDLTVITTGIVHAQCLAGIGGNTIVLASNVMGTDAVSTIGSLCPSIARRFHASLFFASGDGINPESGASVRNPERGAMNARLKELASRTVVLAPPDAFSHIGGAGFAGIEEIDTIVTLKNVPEGAVGKIRSAAQISFVLASPDGDVILEPIGSRIQRSYRIGFGNLSDEFTFSKQVRSSLERAAERNPQVELLVKDNELNRETTLANTRAFVESGVDLVIEYQLDASAGNIIMDTYNRAGIPVIAVDIPMPGATYFGADNYRAGHMAGENLGHWINREWNGRFDYLLKLSIDRAGTLGSARIQGLCEGLSSITGEVPDGRVITLNNMIYGETVRIAVREILPDVPHGSRVAVIGMNDQAVIDALEVFVEDGRGTEVVGVGQNADAAGRAMIVREDFPFIGSTRYAPEEYGEEILALALKILHKETVPPAVLQSHVFIDGKNIEEYYGGTT